MTNRFFLAVLTAAALPLAGCNAERDIYSAPVAKIKQTLIGKSSTYDTGQQKRHMKVTGVSGNSVMVRLFNDMTWNETCSIKVEAVDDNTTRLIPSCGNPVSAEGKAVMGMVEAEVSEHAKHILTGEPVDVRFIQAAMASNAFANAPAMQSEALEADAKIKGAQMSGAVGP